MFSKSSWCCIVLFFYCFIFRETHSKECPDIKILNPYKSRSWIIEGIQIHNSTIRLLRGGSQPGTSQPINNVMVWDMTTNQMLKIFDIDIQISKMLYCKQKRKLLVLGTHKILEVHPLNFNIIDEYNIGGVHIEDVEDSDGLLLISRDQGNHFLYDIYKRQIVETLPYSYLNIYAEGWSTILTLKDYKLFITSKLILFDRNNNNKFIAYLSANIPKPNPTSRACAFKKANFLISSNFTSIIQLGTIYTDSEGVNQYQLHDYYNEIYYPTSSVVPIKFNDLYCVTRGDEYFIIGIIARTDTENNIFKGATVLKITSSTDPNTQQPKYSLIVQEQWKYRRWRKDMEFFIFDEATQRGHSISEYEHYSYEFLESDESQCDFNGDGINDSQCRMAKTICHWVWNLNIGAYFLGPKSEYFFYANDNQKGYQIRDWNSTEILRFSYPRLIDKREFTMRRVIQHSKSTYKLPYDTFILKMCWNYYQFSEMAADHNNNAGFYIYKHENMYTRTTDTYNIISYMNPSSNTEKYKNPYEIMTSFTYNNELHSCVFYTVLEMSVNSNSDTVDFLSSQQYFSHHNKECYKLRDGQVVQFYQLKLPTQIEYGKGIAQYSKCAPYFEGGFLVCKNVKPMLEFWSLTDYHLEKTVDIPGCLGNYDIAVHKNRFYIGCETSIIIYDNVSQNIKTFASFENKVIYFVVIVEDILAIVFSTMEIMVYDLRPADGSAILVLNYYNPQDCCLINAIDIHPTTKRLMWASIIQLNQIDLTPCLENPANCLSCEINAFFKNDPNFSFLKQKYERNNWPIEQPALHVNPKFLDSGLGTLEKPYLMDMNIISLYFKTNLYIQNIVNFSKITLNIYIDTTNEQFMSNYILDWVHEKTIIKFIPWNGSATATVSDKKIKIVINSSKFVNLIINKWEYLDMTNMQIVCPDCISNSLTFTNVGQIYLKNFISSMNLADLIEPAQGQPDTRVFPNIKINVSNVKMFLLESQTIQNTSSEDLNKTPFFTFNNCEEVRMKNIVFSNIVNQESIFESQDSNIILDTILFTKLNTCKETVTKRTKFNIIPFQSLIASNIQFIDNELCDMCLFQNIMSETDNTISNTISISKVDVINNKFDKYQNSRVLFFKMSLVSLISSEQSIEIKEVVFKNNYGSISLDNSYYFEIIKLQEVLLSSISIIDENLVGIGSFNKIQKVTMNNINFINSQYLPESTVQESSKQKLKYEQNLMLLSDIDSIDFSDSKIIGMETNGMVTMQIEESGSVQISNLKVNYCTFKDSLFTSISNLNNEINAIAIQDSIFEENFLQTEESHIQVGLFWIRAEKSPTKIKVLRSQFLNNRLSVNTNTQKKSSISITVENSISDLIVQDCVFKNYYAQSVIGDLFLNIKTLFVERGTFQQNLSDLINSVNTPQSDPDFIQSLLTTFEGTNMKGSFLTVQAQTITMDNCTYQNAISSEGAIQMFPNNNFLQITINNCTFKDLYASLTGTALYISSITSPANIKIIDSYFHNLWLGNIEKLEKAHLYLESSSTSSKNFVSILNLHAYDIGNVQALNQNPTKTQFIYSESFQLNLLNSKIKKPIQQLRNLFENQYDKRYLSTFLDLASVMKSETFLGSSLIQSFKGSVKIQNVEIQGDSLINNNYINAPKEMEMANILSLDQSSVQIDNLTIKDLNINQKGGIILIQNSKKNQLNKLTLSNIQIQKDQFDPQFVTELYQEIGQSFAFINCLKSDCSFSTLIATCDQTNGQRCIGRVINSYEGALSIYDSSFSNFQLFNQNGTAVFVANPTTQLNITGSKFLNLFTSQCGGAMYIYQNNLKIQPPLILIDNTFDGNEGEQYGGAVAIESTFDQSQDNLMISNNQFIENTAYISGAIYFSSFYFSPEELSTNTFQNNKAKMANDIFAQPSGMIVKLVSDDRIETLQLQNNNIYTLTHGSGLQLPKIEVNLFYYDSLGIQHNVDASFLPYQKEILEISMSVDRKTPLKLADSSQYSDFYISGNLFSSYDTQNKTVYFSNIELYGQENSQIYLMITSPIIKKIQVTDRNGNVFYEPYRFIINVSFRGCSKYEIVTSHQISALSSKIKKCQSCPDLSYSKNKELCEQCPIGAVCKQNQEMIVQPGYWKASKETNAIIQCASGFEGCIGGQSVENDLCMIGYIGPLCQECDLFSIRGDGQYTHFGKTLCKTCQINFVGVIMLFGTVYLSVYLTLRAIQSISTFLKAKILVRYLKTIKFKRIREVEQLQSQNILIKILMTYFQLISIIRTVNIKLPNFIPEMSFYVGNPATNATMNINCFMDEYLFDVHYIYYSFYLSLLIPFLHFIILTLVLKFQSLINKELMSINDLKAGIIFFFTYFQPEFIYQAIQLITCKTIGEKKYNQANVSIECDHEVAQFVILAFIIILLSFLLPMMMYAKLTALNKDPNFQNISFQMENCQYAFLSINYKPQCYYWEFIRMGERLLFILIASIFNSNQILKILLLVFVSEGYNFILKQKTPFKNQQFNKLEVVSNHIISVSFLLAIGIYSEDQDNALDTVFYVIFLFINWILITYIFLLVMQEIVNKITDKMLAIIEKNEFLRYLFEKLLACMNHLPFFKLNFDLKVYLSKKKKPLLYQKVREIFLQLLKIKPEDRNIFFLSIKEQRNQSRFISKIMSQFKTQIQLNNKSSNLNQSQASPKELFQQKLDSIILSQPQEQEHSFSQSKRENDSSGRADLTYNRKSFFQSFKLQNHKSSAKDEIKCDKEMTQAYTHKQSMTSISFDQEFNGFSKQNSSRDRSPSNSDNLSDVIDLKLKNQSIYQFPIDSIKRLTTCQPSPSPLSKNGDTTLFNYNTSQLSKSPTLIALSRKVSLFAHHDVSSNEIQNNENNNSDQSL